MVRRDFYSIKSPFAQMLPQHYLGPLCRTTGPVTPTLAHNHWVVCWQGFGHANAAAAAAAPSASSASLPLKDWENLDSTLRESMLLPPFSCSCVYNSETAIRHGIASPVWRGMSCLAPPRQRVGRTWTILLKYQSYSRQIPAADGNFRPPKSKWLPAHRSVNASVRRP